MHGNILMPKVNRVAAPTQKVGEESPNTQDLMTAYELSRPRVAGNPRPQ